MTRMTTWSRAYRNRLPDSAFLFIAAGGHLDERGRTVPRSLRHFPVRDMQGRISVAHLRSVLSGYGSRADIPERAKARAQAYARDMLAHIGDTLAEEAPASQRRVRQARARVRHVGPGAARRAHPRGGHTDVQSILLPKEHFPRKRDAVVWLKKYGHHHDRIEDSGKLHEGRFWRAQQRPPSQRERVRFRVIPFGERVMAVIEARGRSVRTAYGRMRHVGPGEPPAKNASLRHVGPGAPAATLVAQGPKTTIYVAYTGTGHLCCWHHDRSVAAASSARSGGFVRAVRVTPFDWPRRGPNAAEIPAHAMPPRAGRAA